MRSAGPDQNQGSLFRSPKKRLQDKLERFQQKEKWKIDMKSCLAVRFAVNIVGDPCETEKHA